MTWLEKFNTDFYPYLDVNTSGAKRGLIEGMFHRADGFALMFELLLNKKTQDFNIVETGTLRKIDNWKDGQSARLFTEFVDAHGGLVRSVDIDEPACQVAKNLLPSSRFSVTCSDSVDWLTQLTDLDKVDLFYLDSWDVKWKDDGPSADHHLREFRAIESHLQPGTIVAIDDNSRKLNTNQRTGKGRKIVEYLDSIGKYPIYDRYQIIYQF
jgi:predicted O-methyltransferase YrrM